MATALTAFGEVALIEYPGRVIKVGESEADIVREIEKRLNSIGCGPITEDGVFDKNETERAVKLFQARFADTTGRPLVVDGKVGSLTWGALFGERSVAGETAKPGKLADAVISFASTQVGVREKPMGSNDGPEVAKYLKAVGLNPGHAWCVAFTYFCYLQAAESLGLKNPHVKTAGVLDHWNKAKTASGAKRIPSPAAQGNPALISPGDLFIIDFGKGFGHSGIVADVKGGRLVTIEGNTNDGGSREGIGVFERSSRKVASINKGFIHYS